MSDLIDRQAAIDRINKQREHLKPDIDERDAIGDAAYRVCAEFIERLPSAQPEPLTVNFAREMDRETIERLKDGMKNAPVLIMAVNDSVQPDRKPSEWLHELLQDAIDDGIITEVQAVRIVERVNK